MSSPPRRRSARAKAMAFVVLESGSQAPLRRQLYQALRLAILDGRLTPGMRLPSSRALASQLNVARNTALDALDQLTAEGYVVGKHGSGTYVADTLPETLLAAIVPRQAAASRGRARLSRRGIVIARTPVPFLTKAVSQGMAFRLGTPALDAFPAEVWGTLLQRRWRRSSASLLRHRDPRGHEALRRAISGYLNEARGVRCTPEQVVVVTGSQQAVRLIADLVLDVGDRVWVEDPGYTAARGAIVAAGGVPVPVPVDAQGLVVATGRKRAPTARLAVVTPSSQFPLVVTMSLNRRLELLAWARQRRAWILEDDYDSEFRYVGRPLAALQGLDTQGCVFYVGTFSKVLTPVLRVGYVVVPPGLVDAFTVAKALADVRSPVLEQATLADFIDGGHFARHVRRMRRLYEERQDALLDYARRELGETLRLEPAPSGMHLVAWLPSNADDRAVAQRARDHGVWTHPLSAFRWRKGAPGLLLGYAAVDRRGIADGVRALGRALLGH